MFEPADERSLSVLAWFGLLFLAAGIATRAWIHRTVLLPSTDPMLWVAVGTARDLLVFSVAALLLSFFPLRIARVAAATAVVAGIALHVLVATAAIETGSMTGWRSATSRAAVVAALAALIGVAIVALIVTRFTLPLRRAHLAALAATAAVAIPVNVHRRDLAVNPLGVLFTRAQPAAPYVEPKDALVAPQPSRVEEILPRDGRRAIAPHYPLAHRAVPSPLRLAGKPNIVIIGLESVRAEEVGAYGARVAGVTPNLDRLAARGIRFARAYSVGSITPASELAAWYGLLQLPEGVLMTDRPATRLHGLPESLRANGWRSFLWMSSTDENFFRRDLFYVPRGFRFVDGNSFPPDDPRVNWGVSDRALAARSAVALSRLEEPFAAMVLTVNNHHPFQLPADAGPSLGGLPPVQPFGSVAHSERLISYQTSRMIQSVHYTDRALGEFFSRVEREPWFARTIFIITGDHGTTTPPVHDHVQTMHRTAELRHRVPLIIYSPLLPHGRVIDVPTTHADIPTTLLSLLGIHDRSGIGTNVLTDVDRERPLFAWSTQEKMLTIITADRAWHGVLDRSGAVARESLIDPHSDPGGERDLSDVEPANSDRFRRLAGQYFHGYRALVLGDRSGLPRSD